MRHLNGRSLVVMIDNCEHVIGQAAALADILVGSLPALRLIATSREPLGVPGEVLVAVGGLAPPAAVELFVDRARAVRPGFTGDERSRPVIEDICRRLEPAPRCRACGRSTAGIDIGHGGGTPRGPLPAAHRGGPDRPARQQSLRAVVDWSYDLLFDDERRLFGRLAVLPAAVG